MDFAAGFVQSSKFELLKDLLGSFWGVAAIIGVLLGSFWDFVRFLKILKLILMNFSSGFTQL